MRSNAPDHHSTIARAAAAAAFAGLALVPLTTTLTTAPASAASSRPSAHLTGVNGTFIGQPFTITNIQPSTDGFTFDASGGDEWDRALSGHTTYSGRGTINATTGEVQMLLHETFTGTVAGIGSGTIDFVDVLSSGPDDLGTVVCFATGGTGALRGMHGVVGFKATSVVDPDPGGNGTSYGTYAGVLVQ